ncbi:MAG TPA: hypothetical protein VEK15_21450 [Vicinamibacteria bacterium]|nr:hypothetical protein [Vicinamibacteria bacterium]
MPAGTHGAATERLEGAMILIEPPSVDDGEITDKGHINQRAVLRRRAGLVEQLYDDTDPATIPGPPSGP